VRPEIKTEIASLILRLVREEDAEELFLRDNGILAGQVKNGQWIHDSSRQSVDRGGISTIGVKPHSSAGCYRQLSKSGRLRTCRVNPGLNGAKIRAGWDVFCPDRCVGFSPGFHRHLFSVAVCGPKGQDNLAQGLPWVNFPNRIALKGPLPYGEDWPRSEPCAFRHLWSPFRAKHVFMGNPG
jgi:hypothetical protein